MKLDPKYLNDIIDPVNENENVNDIVNEMFNIMYIGKGVGLAANQIGINKTRIITIPIQIKAFAAMFLGTIAGDFYFDLQINIADYGKAAFVGFVFFLSMGSAGIAISTFQIEKGKALSKTIGLIVFLYFFDTIIKLSKSLENLSSYSYFQLYQPGKIVQNQADPGICILISLFIIGVFFIIGIIQFNRRDL